MKQARVGWGIVFGAVLLFGSIAGRAEEPPSPKPDQVDMAEMMKRAARFTKPGEPHKLLERFLGTWDTGTRFIMGGTASPPEKGATSFDWLMEGRWLKYEGSGTMLGMPTRTFGILGYDNFKMSYVTAHVSSGDTALNTSEGDLDPGGKVLLTYGTLDEYLTGEHDKMVKYVWRFPADDQMVLEVHDLPIGETNTKVVEITFSRHKPNP